MVSVVAMLLLYVMVGREPDVPESRDAGAAAVGRHSRSAAAGDSRRRRADRSRLHRAYSQGQGRFTHQGHPAAAGRPQLAVLGQAPGDSIGARGFQDQRQVPARLARIRRRSRVLPRVGGRSHLPAAVGLSRSHRRGDLRDLPARDVRLDRHLSGFSPRRGLQDRRQHVSREVLHARASRDERVAQSQPVRSPRPDDRQRAQETRSGGARADRSGPVPAGRCVARRADRRGGLRGRARRSHRRPRRHPLYRRRGLRARCRGKPPAWCAARRSP